MWRDGEGNIIGGKGGVERRERVANKCSKKLLAEKRNTGLCKGGEATL